MKLTLCFPVTIGLSGDVAEIAQKLANNGQLSSTLSKLLRTTYGFGDRLEEKKRQLHAVLDEKQRLRDQEIELVAEIDTLEAKTIEQRATILPQLTHRLEILSDRRKRVQAEANALGYAPSLQAQKLKALTKIDELIDQTNKEMEEYQ